MRSTIAYTALTAATLSFASPPPPHGPWHGPHPGGPTPGLGGHSTWDLKNFESLVVFGDSYSDDSRLGYFIEREGQAPPTGWVNPVVGRLFRRCMHACKSIAQRR